MAGRLSSVGSRILGGNCVLARWPPPFPRPIRDGPFRREHIVPDKPHDELLWDNGTPFVEPCIDRLAPHIGKYESLAWLCGGLGFFTTLGLLAVWNDKDSKIPFAPNVFPHDNLHV